MKHSPNSTHARLILFEFLHVLILLSMSTCLESATPPNPSTIFGNETDRLVLLDLKKRITHDPLQVMSSWNDSINFCSWEGITCNPSTKRIMILKLEAKRLAGTIPPSIGNLTHLTGFNLMNNSFRGQLPQEIGRLLSLQHLNMSNNSFAGEIPVNISHCTQLTVLDLRYNNLVGSIPNQLSSLLKLTRLGLRSNSLTGSIPDWIGNFSSLNILDLPRNNFQGSMPDELGRLIALRGFAVDENNLSGMIPSSMYNISSLYLFSVVSNQLHGELPQHVGLNLPNLQEFLASDNKFTGTIPVSLSNCSALQMLEIAVNDLTGTVPAENLGNLRSLVGLNFGSNRLGSGKTGDLNFLRFLANCTSLGKLGLDDNYFGGELPASIANLSTNLRLISIGGNLIHGSIPAGIGNLVNLIGLAMDNTYLGGSLPREIGKLHKLQGLYVNHNTFSGPIPSTLGNLTSLSQLLMDDNRFEESIPPSLANCQNLLMLNLSSNNLTGTIPKQLVGLSSLSISLDMSNNLLTGSLPSEVGQLVNLVGLDLSGNKLSGEIPLTLGSCTSLVQLRLEANEFDGTIPQSLSNLRSIKEIDISHNKLSGQIPEFLAKFTFLNLLNISHNHFEGELPKEGIFSNVSGLSILGNNKLCGGIPEWRLPACSSKKPHSSRRLLAPKLVIPIACALAFIIALSCFIVCWSVVKRSRGELGTLHAHKDWKSGVTYLELFESTNGFSVDNLIGSGSFGSVYKGVVASDGKEVAIKVLNLEQRGATKSFIDECKTLRTIRHRNLLKIITVCSSIDSQGNDFKALVFEFMENGSLDMWLHPREGELSQSKRLSLIQRLNIAIDVASAFDYLHNHCETLIVHCDIKPSNVLLDGDMVAHVGDFGLARFLLEPSDNHSESLTKSIGLKGSIGYIPPEYGIGGQISVLGDIYSFGILVLEMFTGKRPNDVMFGDGLTIHQFIDRAMPDHVMDIVDPSILLIETDDAYADDGTYINNEVQERPIRRHEDSNCHVQGRRLEECLVSVIQIGLSCSAISPTKRMLMDVVVNKLKATRDSYLNLRKRS